MIGSESAPGAPVRPVRSRLEAVSYINALIVPLLQRVGLKVQSEQNRRSMTLRIELPRR